MQKINWLYLGFFGVLIIGCGPNKMLDDFERTDITDISAQVVGDPNFLVGLAKKYAPQLREHEKEKFPLANANWFLKKAGLMQVKDGKEIVLIQPGQVTIEKLKNLNISVNGKNEPVMRKSGTEGDIETLKLYIPKDNYKDVTSSKGANPACYAYPRYVDQGQAIEISYIFFNPYNGTVGSNIPLVTPLLDSLGVGHHEGDWEHITVRLDKLGSNILGVFYATHGAAEGKWYKTASSDLKSENGYKIRNGRLITWSALDTHGNHNRSGNIHREPPSAFKAIIKTLGLLVEKTSDNGRQYDCRNILQVFSPDNPSKNHPWLDFRGRWGGKPPKLKADVRGPDGPAFKDWWRKEENWK
jgi:hypothetical protein